MKSKHPELQWLAREGLAAIRRWKEEKEDPDHMKSEGIPGQGCDNHEVVAPDFCSH